MAGSSPEARFSGKAVFDWRLKLAAGLTDLPELAGYPGLPGNYSKEKITSSALRQNARRLAARTKTITMLAGSGTRWTESLIRAGRHKGAEPAAAAAMAALEGEPRGLYPVRNFMGFGPDPVPIAGYALAAVKDLGSHIIVVRGWQKEIVHRVLIPLALDSEYWTFAEQEAPSGLARGHGDGLYQTMDKWENSDYLLVNFGGDAANPVTALAALSVMDALCTADPKSAPDLILPVCLTEAALYPVELDSNGLPEAFGHSKLKVGAGQGTAALQNGAMVYSNVGLRIYRTEALKKAITEIRHKYWTAAGGYKLPGNAPAPDAMGGEFALDNVDYYFAQRKKARILHVARPEELSPVKKLEDIAAFERNMAILSGDWSSYYSNSGRGFEK
ncbi:hypothetical protein MASR2M29_19230 [Spirochaetota bacterium]